MRDIATYHESFTSTPTRFPPVCGSLRSPTEVCLRLVNENSRTTFFNLESGPIVGVIELYTSVFNSAGVEALLSSCCVPAPTALLTYQWELVAGGRSSHQVFSSSGQACSIVPTLVLIGARMSNSAVGDWSAILQDTQVCH